MRRTRPPAGALAAGGGFLVLLLLPLLPGSGFTATPTRGVVGAAACEAPPDYYSFELHPTGTTPSARGASGKAEVGLVDSPFDLALSAEGRFERRVTVRVEGVRTAPGETLVAWAAPPELEPLVRLGPFEPGETVDGVLDFNKFLVFVSIEPAGAPAADRWTGPIVLRGMSRSGRLRSMASHGMFEPEPC